MYAVIRRALVALIVGLCAASLSLHFAAESIGGIPNSFVEEQPGGLSDSHEADQFVLSDAGNGNPARTWILLPFTTRPKINSRPLTPLFPPPKSI